MSIATTAQIEGISFADEQSKANFYTALSGLPVNGFRPLVVINANRPGLGKTFLARQILRERSAHPVAFRMPKTDDSFRRFIPAVLEDGYLFLDDVIAPLDSSLLAELLTAKTWEYRKLGSAEKQTRKVDLVVLVTGNNVRLSYDLQRRAIWINLA